MIQEGIELEDSMRTLTFAAVVAATTLHAEEPIESLARDIHEQQPTPCKLANEPLWTNTYSYGMVFHRLCNAAETRARMEQHARGMRERLGDPGRH